MPDFSLVPSVTIMATKGGTGKSTVTKDIAIRLGQDTKVAVIDMDVDSPNLPKLMGIKEEMDVNPSMKFIPVRYPGIPNKHGRYVKLFSMGCFFNDGKQAFARTGEQNRILLKQALNETNWGSPEIFLLDQPAGSSDEFRALVNNFKNIIGAIIVTQPTTSEDLLRCFDLTSQFGIPILSVIENMKGAVCNCGEVLTCKHCDSPYNPLGDTEIEQLTTSQGIIYAGAIPIIPNLPKGEDLDNDLIPDKWASPILEIVTALRGIIKEDLK